jgi:hypothetical protein
MKQEEDEQIGHGLYNPPNSAQVLDSKAMRIFMKLKRKAKQAEPAQSQTALVQTEPNLEELRQSTYRSLHIGPEVIKTENGFEIA